MVSGMPALRHATHCVAAVRSTPSPSAWMSPDSSASGMNTVGGTTPCSGSVQRRLERVLLQAMLGEVRIQELVGVAAEVLRAVHRDVGVLQELVRVVGVVR